MKRIGEFGPSEVIKDRIIEALVEILDYGYPPEDLRFLCDDISLSALVTEAQEMKKPVGERIV